MTTINLALILVAVVLGVLNALMSGRTAHVIAGGFARVAHRRALRLADEIAPPSSHRLQPCS